jgi:hypothetical protein
MATQRKSPAKKQARVTKKVAAAKIVRSRSLRTMTHGHAKTLIGHVNGLLAEHGFSAQVSELHFVPTGADSMGCENCEPPSVCKRVCFINDQGVPECEDRCVAP